MTHLDILLPFGLPPEELAADLFRSLKTPAFATLVGRAKAAGAATRHQTFDEFSRSLPHETWLARQFGMEEQLRAGGTPPIAQAAMRLHDLPANGGTWFIISPVHIHVARDHLVLSDARQLALSEQESRTLFAIAQPLFEEAGKSLLYGNADTWFARSDDWHDLQTATPDAAAGHNIDIWMPKGPGERGWRKLQNEVQMHWFDHPLQQQREARGDKAVNSIWLWAGTPTDMQLPVPAYREVFNLSGWFSAFGQLAARQLAADAVPDLLAQTPQRGLLVLDDLLAPALAGDWSQWLDRLHFLEAEWMAPLLAALKSGKLDQLSLVLTHHARISTFTASRPSLRKFWLQPSLAPLVS